jgi:hypothetical protein
MSTIRDWAELASQHERLAEPSDGHAQQAQPEQPGRRHAAGRAQPLAAPGGSGQPASTAGRRDWNRAAAGG